MKLKNIFAVICAGAAALLPAISVSAENALITDTETVKQLVEQMLADNTKPEDDVRCFLDTSGEKICIDCIWYEGPYLNADLDRLCAENGLDRSLVALAEAEVWIHDKGDLDRDKTVSLGDAQTVLAAYTEQLAGKQILGYTERYIADVDSDAAVTLDDAQYILQYYVSNTLAGLRLESEGIIYGTEQTNSGSDRRCGSGNIGRGSGCGRGSAADRRF